MSLAPERVLIVMPTWVGDCVMATPTLRALRHHWPDAHVTLLTRRTNKPLLRGLTFADRIVAPRQIKKVLRLGRSLKAGRFDLAVLLPNSFKAALLAKVAGIANRVGYDRDGRGFLLTDKLLPPREGSQFKVVPTLNYYLELARHLGAEAEDKSMSLAVTAKDQAEADRVIERLNIDLDQRHILLNPGASYGAAKLWLPKYFAEVADVFAERGYRVLMSTAPAERQIAEEILDRSRRRPIDLASAGMTLGALKVFCRSTSLCITNDTGPRHIAVAMGTRVITVFGPTDPRWTTLNYDRELELQEDVFCGPCQKKICPLDHRCMIQLTPDKVIAAADALLEDRAPALSLPVVARAVAS